jgi:putative membrane protein
MLRIGMATLALGWGVAAYAQNPDKPTEKRQQPPKEKPQDKPKPGEGVDKQFLEEAARGGLLEVRLGELAAKQGANEDVKKFGQMMVADHTKMNDTLRQLSQKHNVTLPKDLDEKGQKEVARLSKLTGAEFDREYMTLMVNDHTNDVKTFQQQAKQAKNEEVRTFAETSIKTLEHHLQQARSIREKLG